MSASSDDSPLTLIGSAYTERDSVATVATAEELATVASPDLAAGKVRRRPNFDAERETAKLAKRLRVLAETLGDDSEARARLAALLMEHGQALGGTAMRPSKGAKAAKQANDIARAEVAE